MNRVRKETEVALQQLRELAAKNDIDFYLTSSPTQGEPPLRIDEPAGLPPTATLFYGGDRLYAMLSQFQDLRAGKRYDGVLLLSDDESLDSAMDDPATLAMREPLWVEHLGGRLSPGYNDATLLAIQRSGGGVIARLPEALFAIELEAGGNRSAIVPTGCLRKLSASGDKAEDIKPSNILVIQEAAGWQVKVLDFGLALAGGSTRWEGSGIAGTPAYLAPEVIDGEPPSERADLYAVGVIFYEILVGRHPFGGSAVPLAKLLDAVIQGRADLSPLADRPLLQTAVAQLLAKDPTRRFSSADAALAAILTTIPAPDRSEPEAVRESFLQAASFVGRDHELAQLTQALEAVGRGAGTAWLIGGESGVGKSRLLDELRTLAMVQGVLVARGQAVTEGGAYRIFRDALRLLCLQVELSDLEAAVLATLLPDLGPLLGRELPPAPPVEAQAAQLRLLNIVESVLHRQVQPVLLLLEDLHWADKESLALLRRILRWVHQRALLLVGSYQDDEAPDLPAALPGAQLLKLGRLDQLSIKALCASMLGPAGERPEMVELITRETERNSRHFYNEPRTYSHPHPA